MSEEHESAERNNSEVSEETPEPEATTGNATRTATLFSPGEIGVLKLANRVVFSPLPTGLAGSDGTLGPELTQFLLARAEGGCGLVVTETFAVADDDKIPAHTPRLATNDAIAGLRALREAFVNTGVPLAVTLTRFPFNDVSAAPAEELQALPEQFAKAAWRAQVAGVDAVVLHFGGGHAVGQILSPATNQREDDYGGELNNRLRVPLEIPPRDENRDYLRTKKEKMGHLLQV